MLVLSVYSTHILQLFDVALAGPMKGKFRQLLHKFLKAPSKVIPNNWSVPIRLTPVEVIVQAWQMMKTAQNCRAAGESVGYSPDNQEIPKGSDFVRKYIEAEELNQMRMIQRIRDETTNGRTGYMIMPCLGF